MHYTSLDNVSMDTFSNHTQSEIKLSEEEVLPIAFPADNSSTMEPISHTIWKRNQIMYDVIKDFSVKDKRTLFQHMRNYSHIAPDTLFPKYGLTAGQFSTYNILTEHNRRRQS